MSTLSSLWMKKYMLSKRLIVYSKFCISFLFLVVYSSRLLLQIKSTNRILNPEFPVPVFAQVNLSKKICTLRWGLCIYMDSFTLRLVQEERSEQKDLLEKKIPSGDCYKEIKSKSFCVWRSLLHRRFMLHLTMSFTVHWFVLRNFIKGAWHFTLGDAQRTLQMEICQ